MLTDATERSRLEQFLRNASADELIAQRSQLQDLLAAPSSPALAQYAEWLSARIAYELRFRLPQPV